jgi:DNA-directed RNA polymerase subunit N (RpoN/RPB10)
MPFICEICNYSTNKKGNLQKHFTTTKHKEAIKHINNYENEVKKVLPIKNKYICKDCCKEHKNSQMLYHHRSRVCEHSEKAQMYKLKKRTEKLEKDKNKLKTIMLKNCDLSNTTNINDNSITNNDNRIIIQLNGYSKTDTSHLTDNNHVEIMTNIVKFLNLVHANPDKPENMNLLLTSLQDTHMKVYENDKWKSVQKNEHLEKIITGLYDLVEKWMFDNESKLSPQITNKWKRFYEKIVENDDTRETAKDELAIELYNNRKMIGNNKNTIEDEEESKIKEIKNIIKI